MKPLLLLVGLVACATAETHNTITFGAGLAQNVGNYCCGESAPSLSLTYAYRLLPHVDIEVGAVSALALGTEIRGAHYDVQVGDRMLWIPFGVRAVLPLKNDRVELSAGGGGAYQRYDVSTPFLSGNLDSRDGWGGYAVASAAVALDDHRHFWLSATPRFLFSNTNGYRDRWFTVSGGFGVRF